MRALASLRPSLREQFRRPESGFAIQRQYQRPHEREADRDGFADTATGAGDKRPFSVKLHWISVKKTAGHCRLESWLFWQRSKARGDLQA